MIAKMLPTLLVVAVMLIAGYLVFMKAGDTSTNSPSRTRNSPLISRSLRALVVSVAMVPILPPPPAASFAPASPFASREWPKVLTSAPSTPPAHQTSP